jgi:hypothetical protein
VEQYLTRLVENAKVADQPEDLVELREQITSAISMLEILQNAQAAIEMKLLGLDPEDDPRFTTYEYHPQSNDNTAHDE